MASEKPGSSLGCCILKIVAVLGAVALVIGLGIGFMLWRAASWLAQMPEPAPAQHPPLVISAGEQEDVDRVRVRLDTVKQDKSVVDETVTPIILNGVIDALFQQERAKNKNMEAQTVRTGFDGDHLMVEATWKLTDQQGQQKYLNF